MDGAHGWLARADGKGGFSLLARIGLLIWLLLFLGVARAEDPWTRTGEDGRAEIQLYFFWSLRCPHCVAAHPHVEAWARERSWLRLHALEVSRHPENLGRYRDMAGRLGQEAASVPAFLFCGEMHAGWGGEEATGAFLLRRLEDCRMRVAAGGPASAAAVAAPSVRAPFLGELDAASFSLPTLTLILAGLDAFNPCAFFVLLFLLSMLAHQKSRGRMLLIGGVFVLVSGGMYFAFMAAWLNVFQLFGHLAWVTLAAGALALFAGSLNVKDFFLFGQGPTLSIPESRKPDLFRRVRAILDADNLAAMSLATLFLAVAANFYELLCTAGFPMVYTRLLTLAELSAPARLAYLAAYNLIYVIPLALIVVVFARTLGARKLTEREGRLLKLLSGLMMLQLGLILLLAPEWMGRAGVAFLTLAVAAGLTVLAARRIH